MRDTTLLARFLQLEGDPRVRQLASLCMLSLARSRTLRAMSTAAAATSGGPVETAIRTKVSLFVSLLEQVDERVRLAHGNTEPD